MISLYQALKSLALVVSALFSAMNPRRDCGEDVCFAHSLLGAAPEISEHHLAPGALIRSHHNSQASLSGIGKLQLLSHRLGPEGIFDPESRIPQPVTQSQQLGKVVLGDE